MGRGSRACEGQRRRQCRASTTAAIPTKMLSSAKSSLERLATPRNKGYASVAVADEEELGIIDEQLRSDGWHLDDVDDDEKLDFVLPTSKRKSSWMSSVCCCCSAGTDRRL